MTRIEAAAEKAITRLRLGPATATQIGEWIYGRPWRKPQAYSRPGGRVLRWLAVRGVIERHDTRERMMWRLRMD